MNDRTWGIYNPFAHFTAREHADWEFEDPFALLTDWQRTELDRRLERLASEDGIVQTWESMNLAAQQPQSAQGCLASGIPASASASSNVLPTEELVTHNAGMIELSSAFPSAPFSGLTTGISIGRSSSPAGRGTFITSYQQSHQPLSQLSSAGHLRGSSASPAGHGTFTYQYQQHPSLDRIPTMTIQSPAASIGIYSPVPVTVHVLIQVSSSIIMWRGDIEQNQSYSHARNRLPQVQMPRQLCPPHINPDYLFPKAFLDWVRADFRAQWNVGIELVPVPLGQWKYIPHDSRTAGHVHYSYCFLAYSDDLFHNDPSVPGLSEVSPDAAIGLLNEWEDSYTDGIAIGFSRFSNLFFLKVYRDSLENRVTDHVRCMSLREMERNYRYWR